MNTHTEIISISQVQGEHPGHVSVSYVRKDECGRTICGGAYRLLLTPSAVNHDGSIDQETAAAQAAFSMRQQGEVVI